jgi:hypothetical protein
MVTGIEYSSSKFEKIQRRFLKFLHLRVYNFYPECGFPQDNLLSLFSFMQPGRETFEIIAAIFVQIKQ